MLYKKKPVVVEAMQYTPETMAECLQFLKDNGARYVLASTELKEVDIKLATLDGTLTAKYGDYIVKGVHGEFYPCKPSIFKATYENYGDFKVIDALNYLAAGLVEPGALLDLLDYDYTFDGVYTFDGKWFTRPGQKGMEPLEVHSVKALNESVCFFATRRAGEVEKIDLTGKD
ncbi:hypothetical protein MMI99_00920 [Enterococcus cecorum]|uniref:hypothetical protein n=1 Tax=Enterococcus cecorum TaxID=44008 RepID=UPI001FABC632|nr:hypothetical protein [Enterococcus cecorum]MCJ0586561.1 hypothetical protein [Enterococcus cecorum]MCJ0591239.1 hypothetical protein [Enterococcus cecorum]